MEVQPSSAYEGVAEVGDTGLVGVISYRLDDNAGNTVIAASTANIIELGATGIYVAARTSPATQGQYTEIWSTDGTFSAESVLTGELIVTVAAESPAPIPPPTGGGLQPGPCTAWTTAEDVAACCSVDVGTDTALFDASVDAASQTLFELSGRLYAGLCEKTVRPCNRRDWCGWQVLSRGHLVGWDGIGWSWWSDGEYLRSCGCRPLDRVWLSGYPVRSITEVKIDGDVVDPDTYRLDENRYLSRVRDPADPDTVLMWPRCQNLDLPDTEDGTFSVTYEYGAEPPFQGIEAAKQLACQIYLACTGSGDCQLPVGATRVTRQGITIERQSFARDAQTGSWRTGLTLVDLFLNTVNPGGQRRRPVVWSPDGHRYARPVGS